jgi:hypothetical protein
VSGCGPEIFAELLNRVRLGFWESRTVETQRRQGIPPASFQSHRKPATSRPARRVLAPCFSINHSSAPQSFNPVLSTNRCTGSAGSGHLQCLASPAQGGVFRHRKIKAEKADERADQTFGLAQREVEDCPQRQRCQNSQRRIPTAGPGSSAARRARWQSPLH